MRLIFPDLRVPVLMGICALLLPVSRAEAHPHIFVDAGLSIEVDSAGRVQAVEVTWAYDDFYSMLIFEDLMVDQDYDGALTSQELAQLAGFDLKWSEGYLGDLYLTRGDESFTLGAPELVSTEVSDGRITSRHRREVVAHPNATGLAFKMYDPTYYTAYTLDGGVGVTGPCTATVVPPDLDRAYSMVEEMLYAQPVDPDADVYPEVGAAFASEVLLECET